MSSIVFGTSGLRAPASAFDAEQVHANIGAFLDHVGVSPGVDVFVGCDLRASSPSISRLVMAAVTAHGQHPRWCGVVPTPALALAALVRQVPAIMVTGSHIPEDYNGIKFYRPDGELLKDDEAPIRCRVDAALAAEPSIPAAAGLPVAEDVAALEYRARFIKAYGPDALKGLRLGVFAHSAAGRELLASILDGLGADLVRFGRSERFVAVDTEALDPQSVVACAAEIDRHGLDAVVSTDGDGDRPLLIGADGQQVNGDVLCTLAARALGVRTIVTPLTSTSAIEHSRWFDAVVRTRIGSPYVVAAMKAEGGTALAGFEANGGFLLGSPVDLSTGSLAALPTRDAVLPLVAVLCQARRRGGSVADLVAELPARVMKADRLKQIPPALSAGFLSEVAASALLRKTLAQELEQPVAIDLTDGVRFNLEDGSIVHFRASGNAPELRVYVETESPQQTAAKLAFLMPRLADLLAARADNTGKHV